MADSGGPEEPSTNTPEENRFLEEQRRLAQARLDLLQAEEKILTSINSSYSERLTIEQQINEVELQLGEINRSLGNVVGENLEEQVRIREEILDKARKENKEVKKETELVEKLGKAERERYDQAVAKIEEINKKQAITRRGQEASSRLLGQISSGLDANIPQALKGLRDIAAVGKSQGIKGLTSILKGGAFLGAIKAIQFIFEAVVGVREEFVEINRVTLGNREILQTFKDIATDVDFARKAALKFGKSTGDVAKSLTEMYKETSVIQRLAEESSTNAIANLGLVAAKFEDFGVSSAQTANVIDIAVRNMGMSTEETTRLMKSLTGEASIAAQNMPKFIDNFVSQYPKLRIYGDRSIDIFTKLNKKTSDVGVSMDSIMGIGRVFESYESAAMATTQLNMLLGSNFDALKMMAASPDELFGMLRQNISASDLRQMGQFQRRYLASILQIEYDQLERIVTGKGAKERIPPGFDFLVSESRKDSQVLKGVLDSIKSGIGTFVSKLIPRMIEILRSIYGAVSQLNPLGLVLDALPGTFAEFFGTEDSENNKTLSSANVKKLTEQRAKNLKQGPDANERALMNFTLEKGLAAAVSKIEASDTNAETQKTLIDLMTKFVEDKSNVEATNKLYEFFADNKISVEIVG